MALESITLIGPPGVSYVSHDVLKYSKVITVTREGTGYDLTTETPGNRQVKHTSATGRIDFQSDNIFYFKLKLTDRIKYYETVNITYQR